MIYHGGSQPLVREGGTRTEESGDAIEYDTVAVRYRTSTARIEQSVGIYYVRFDQNDQT